MVKAVQLEVRDKATDLLPNRAAELLIHVSALLGNINDEIRLADLEYAVRLLEELEKDQAANRAKIRAECTPAYVRKREARDTKELALELVRSLKYYLKAKDEERREARMQ